MFAIDNRRDASIFQKAMQMGYLQAKQEEEREKERGFARETMTQRIMLEEEARRKREQERFKNEAFLKGFSEVGEDEFADEAFDRPEGLTKGPYGKYWRTPQAPEAPPGFSTLQTGPYDYSIKETPGWKPGSKEEAREMKEAGRAGGQFTEPYFDPAMNGYMQKDMRSGRLHKVSPAGGQFTEPYFDPSMNGYMQKDMRSGRLHKVSPAEMEPNQAYQRLSKIEQSKATLEKGNMITQALVALNPDLAGLMGQSIGPETKQALFERWDNESEYLNRYLDKYPGARTQGKTYRYNAQGELMQ